MRAPTALLPRRALVLAPLAALAGCASPNPALYTLASSPGRPQGGAPAVVELRQISLAAYLDRPGLVLSAEGVQLQLARNERWAAPLAEVIGRVLIEDLLQRLPGTTVYSTIAAISTPPDATVELDIQRFDGDGAGNAVIRAQLGVRARPGEEGITRTLRLQVPARSAAVGDLVAALSVATGQLADAIAEALLALKTQPGKPPPGREPGRRGRR